jgi:MSHA biogenesis protein MshM
MYLEHFHLKEFPFSLTPNTSFYCKLPEHQAALNTLLVSLQNGEGFIKITGEVGTGKTLLCRKLLDSLDENYVTAYVPNPDLTPDGLRKALAHELEIEFDSGVDQHELLQRITEKLLTIHAEGKHAVLIVDEAQAMKLETLEAIRLLTNLETESEKLLQIILFGQPELDKRLLQPELRQLKQRISFQHKLAPVDLKQMQSYIHHRLAIAGHTYNALFSRKAAKLIHRASQGIPRVINMLCHKSLLSAYGKNKKLVDTRSARLAIKDNQEIVGQASAWNKVLLTSLALIVIAAAIAITLSITL